MTDTMTDAPAPATTNTAFTRQVRYATFNARLLAAMADMTIVTVIGFPLMLWLQSLFFEPVNGTIFMGLFSGAYNTVEMNQQFWRVIREQHVVEKIILNNVLQVVAIALYYLPCWFYYGNTPGKILAGIEILDSTTYQPMTRKQAIARFCGYIISAIPLTLGFAWMIFDRRKQCWHDKIGHTVVLRKEKKSAAPAA